MFSGRSHKNYKRYKKIFGSALWPVVINGRYHAAKQIKTVAFSFQYM